MRKFYTWAIVIGIFFLSLDQVTKVLVERAFRLGETLPLLSFFSLTYVRNQGAAWGMFQGAHYILAGVAVLAIVLFICFWRQLLGSSPWMIPIGGLLFSGIIGNCIDRIRLGYVVDFLDFHWGTYYFPCFNVADSAICVAVCLIFILQFLKKDKS